MTDQVENYGDDLGQLSDDISGDLVTDIEKIMEETPRFFNRLYACVPYLEKRWWDIGVQLQFTAEELNEINSPLIPCCKKMLYLWKQRNKDVTASNLISVIKSCGEDLYASQLQDLGEGTVTDLAYLQNNIAPNIATIWYSVGWCLKIPTSDLKSIKRVNGPCESKCLDMLRRWYNRNPNDPDISRRPTWKNMYDAMMTIGLVDEAEYLKGYLQEIYNSMAKNALKYQISEIDRLKPTFPVLTKYFEGVIGWKDLARNLLDDHDGSIAKQIEMNYPFDHEVCIMAVVHKFLTGSNVSWKKVLESLEALELFHVANDIKKDLIAGRSPLSGMSCSLTFDEGGIQKPTYQVLMKYFEKEGINWKKLAAYLLDFNKLEDIVKRNPDGGIDCLTSMIQGFLRSDDVSWKKVLTALNASQYLNLARIIENDLDVGLLPTQEFAENSLNYPGIDEDHRSQQYAVVAKYLGRVKINWKTMTAYLLKDVDGTKTEIIEKSHNFDASKCRAAVIQEYFKGDDVSVQEVLIALRNAGYRNLAITLENDLTGDTHLTQGIAENTVDAERGGSSSKELELKFTARECYAEPTYPLLMKYLENVDSWEDLSIFLLDDDFGTKADRIRSRFPHGGTDCHSAMVEEYLRSGDVSWKKVIESLKEIEYNQVAEDIKEDLGGDIPLTQEDQLDLEMLKIMLQARENGQTINVRYGKAILVGSSAAGKSSFFRLMMKKEHQPQHISTGLANSLQLTFATKVDVSTSGEQVEFLQLDLEKEINELQSRLQESQTHDNASHVQLGEVIENHDISTHVKIAHSEVIEKYDNSTHAKIAHSEVIEKANTIFTSVEKEMAASVTIRNVPRKSLQETWDILTFIDSGGQPQYITMLPAVNSSAMITFVVYNMKGGVEGLDSPVVVAHGDEKGNPTFPPYSIKCTNLELIKTLMTMTNNRFVHKKSFLDKVCVKKGNSFSFLSFIGTHQDEVCEDMATNLSKVFDLVVSEGDIQHVWIHQNKYLIPVDNTSSGTANEDKHAAFIRKELYNLIQKQDIYSVPIVWVLLELEIRKVCKETKRSFITYNEIRELCKQRKLGSDEEFIKNALRFHHLFGVLLYYEEVDGMRDLVITDHQWLLDNLTKIVYYSYSEFSDTKVHEDFEHKGIFNETLLEKIDVGDESIQTFGIDRTFDVKKSFLNLLGHLRIIAPLVEQKYTVRYFMPSLLSMCNPASLQGILCKYGKCETKGSCNIEPLLIQFTSSSHDECGSVSSNGFGALPRGVFCCLVVELMQKSIEWRPQWSKDENELFCNLVTFYASNNQCYVTLIDKIFYLEVQIRSKEKIHPSLFFRIRVIITKALKKVGEKLSLYKFSLSYGFLCYECGGVSREHMTTVLSKNNEAFCHYDKPTLLNFSHKVWLESRLEQKGISSGGTDGSKFVSKPNNQTLTKYFERVAEWKKLAAFLLNDDDGSKTHLIEKSNHYDVGDCRGAMIREYLKSGNISWETVLSCLRSAGYKNLADDIEKDLNIDLSIQENYESDDVESSRYKSQRTKKELRHDRKRLHSSRDYSHQSRSRSSPKRRKRTEKLKDDRESSRRSHQKKQKYKHKHKHESKKKTNN